MDKLDWWIMQQILIYTQCSDKDFFLFSGNWAQVFFVEQKHTKNSQTTVSTFKWEQKHKKWKKVLKFRMRQKKIFGSICLQTLLTFCVGGGAGTNFVVAYAQHSRMDAWWNFQFLKIEILIICCPWCITLDSWCFFLLMQNMKWIDSLSCSQIEFLAISCD